MSRSRLEQYTRSHALFVNMHDRRADGVFRSGQIAPGLEPIIHRAIPKLRRYNPDLNHLKTKKYTNGHQNTDWHPSRGEKVTPYYPEMQVDFYGYDPEEEGYREIFESLGNGFLSVPTTCIGSKTEKHTPGVFVNGYYETRLLQPHEVEGKTSASPVPKLVKMPVNELFIDNGYEELDLDTANIHNYHTRLNMQSGTVITDFDWIDSLGHKIHIRKIKIVSNTRHHVIAEKMLITPDFKTNLRVRSVITNEYENVDGRYLETERIGPIQNVTANELHQHGIYLLAKGIETGRGVAVGSRLQIVQKSAQVHEKRSINETFGDKVSEEVSFEVMPGQTYAAETVMNIYTSRETHHPMVTMIDELQKLPSFDILYKEHAEAFHNKWDIPNITIVTEDKSLQQKVNYNLFHLLQQGQSMDPNISVFARSATEYYNGHVFWDMDICDMPFFIASNPNVARMHLLYRYINKVGAQKKAMEFGLEGMFPYWESTLATSHKDATPKYAKNPNGKFGVVHTKEKSYHIASDVAYAVWQYYLFTGDKKFLRNFGAELIIETAKFWISKLKKDNQIIHGDQIHNPLHLRSVIGPDEYQEFDPELRQPGINDNYFTNKMAQMNIRYALALAHILDTSALRYLGLSNQILTEWEKFANNIVIPYDKQTKLFAQFDKVHHLEPFPFREFYPGDEEVNMRMIEDGFDPSQYAVIKQADVLLGMFLAHEKDKSKWVANYRKYERETSHGSSLSRWVHVIAAIKAGEMEEAYEHFEIAVNKAYKKSNGLKRGIPVAALGGVWQAIVFGFGGLDISERGIMIDPYLPFKVTHDGNKVLHWKELEYGFLYQGAEVHVRITKERIFYSATKDVNIKSTLPLVRIPTPEVRLATSNDESMVEKARWNDPVATYYQRRTAFISS